MAKLGRNPALADTDFKIFAVRNRCTKKTETQIPSPGEVTQAMTLVYSKIRSPRFSSASHCKYFGMQVWLPTVKSGATDGPINAC